MSIEMLVGQKVKLSALDPERLAPKMAAWNMNTKYWRLANADPSIFYSVHNVRNWIEKTFDEKTAFHFMVETVEDGKIIGMLELDGIDWLARNSWVGIAIGEEAYWGQGYGTEAMALVIHYGFHFLNLNRINLSVFEYNPRAIRSYQKLGFVEEGRLRKWLRRDGRYWDMLEMALFQKDWEAKRYWENSTV